MSIVIKELASAAEACKNSTLVSPLQDVESKDAALSLAVDLYIRIVKEAIAETNELQKLRVMLSDPENENKPTAG